MDDELAAIRAARLQELQRNAGQAPAGQGNGGNQGAGASQGQSALLAQVLEPQARERLSRVRMVKPDRAQAVEEYLLKLAQMGQLRHKLSEQEIVEILDGMSRDSTSASATKVTFSRKADVDEDEEDEDDFFD